MGLRFNTSSVRVHFTLCDVITGRVLCGGSGCGHPPSATGATRRQIRDGRYAAKDTRRIDTPSQAPVTDIYGQRLSGHDLQGKGGRDRLSNATAEVPH
ncbi:unnamed protein product, partial [Iphiclides podalirius]